MFKKLSIVGLAGVLALVGGGLTVALAGNNITSPETLVLTETSLKGKLVDVGKQGFGPGDSFMLNKLDETTERAEVTRTEGLQALKQELTVHETIEEEILYPALAEFSKTRDITFEAYEEQRAPAAK